LCEICNLLLCSVWFQTLVNVHILLLYWKSWTVGNINTASVKFSCVFHDGISRSGGIALCSHNLSTRQRWVVISMPQPLYSIYPPNRGLDRPYSWSGCFGDEKNLLLVLRIESWFPGFPACSLVIVPNKLYQLLKSGLLRTNVKWHGTL